MRRMDGHSRPINIDSFMNFVINQFVKRLNYGISFISHEGWDQLLFFIQISD